MAHARSPTPETRQIDYGPYSSASEAFRAGWPHASEALLCHLAIAGDEEASRAVILPYQRQASGIVWNERVEAFGSQIAGEVAERVDHLLYPTPSAAWITELRETITDDPVRELILEREALKYTFMQLAAQMCEITVYTRPLIAGDGADARAPGSQQDLNQFGHPPSVPSCSSRRTACHLSRIALIW